MFDDRFIESLSDDPVLAARGLYDTFVHLDGLIPPEREESAYEQYLEAYGTLQGFCEIHGLSFRLPELGNNRQKNIHHVRVCFNTAKSHFDEIAANLAVRRGYDHILAGSGRAFAYEFSDGDLNRVQTVLNELRDLIVASELFDANHKQRIMRKLENLQTELHKKVSSLDRFWGLIGEAGVALGKFGKDAKPFVDRIKEIAQIVWRTQARAEELPSATPLSLLTDGLRTERSSETD